MASDNQLSMAAFSKAITNALTWHRGCNDSMISEWVRVTCEQFGQHNIRPPDDWQPEYTGVFTMRWYNNKSGAFSDSKRHVSASVVPHQDSGMAVVISGRMETKGYSSESQFRMPPIGLQVACRLLVSLIQIVDAVEAKP